MDSIKEKFIEIAMPFAEKVKAFLTTEKLESLYGKGKKEFQEVLDMLDEETKAYLLETGDYAEGADTSGAGDMVYKRVKEVMRKNVLEHKRRLDGRAPE